MGYLYRSMGYMGYLYRSARGRMTRMSEQVWAIISTVLVLTIGVAASLYLGIWLSLVFSMLAVVLLVGCIYSHQVTTHTPHLLCFMGMATTVVYAFEHATEDPTRFWITLERATLLATGILSICYWVKEFFIKTDKTVEDMSRRRLGFMVVRAYWGSNVGRSGLRFPFSAWLAS